MTSKGRILLLGANDQALLSVARQLSRYGFLIDVADWQDLPVKHSRFLDKYYQLSDIEINVEIFLNDLIALIKSNNYLFLLPVNDVGLEVCVKFRKALEVHIKLISVPDHDAYDYSHNKYFLIKKCAELGLPFPHYFYIETLKELEQILSQINYPVIVKPVYSKNIKNNKLFQFRVRKAYNERNLIDIVRENIMNVPLLLQENVSGFGVGYNVLAKEGNVLMAYQHERLNEPLGGGASSYRKTNPVDTYGLKQYSEKLIKAINWTGPGMIEYKLSNGIPYIMELNGRFWVFDRTWYFCRTELSR